MTVITCKLGSLTFYGKVHEIDSYINTAELQIKTGNRDNSEIIFLISPRKHTL